MVLMVVVAGCGGTGVAAAPSRTRHDVRVTAERFLAALGRGDGASACRLLSPVGMRNAGYPRRHTWRACVKDQSHVRVLGRSRVVRVRIVANRTAHVSVRNRSISESGVLELHRYGDRWLIDYD